MHPAHSPLRSSPLLSALLFLPLPAVRTISRWCNRFAARATTGMQLAGVASAFITLTPYPIRFNLVARRATISQMRRNTYLPLRSDNLRRHGRWSGPRTHAMQHCAIKPPVTRNNITDSLYLPSFSHSPSLSLSSNLLLASFGR